MKINFYIFFIILSFIIGFSFIYINLIIKSKMSKTMIISLFLLNMVCTIYFAKLLTILISKNNTINILNAGLSSLGGLFGLLLSILIFIKLYKNNTQIIVDTYALAIPLMYGISKLGCQYIGCCEGIPYKGIFHTFSKLRNDNVSLFPNQLLETIIFLIIFFVSITLFYQKVKLNYFSLELIICSIAKFLLDYLRYFHIGKIITTNQIICIIFFIIGILTLKKRHY